jgi:hypothetical protein
MARSPHEIITDNQNEIRRLTERIKKTRQELARLREENAKLGAPEEEPTDVLKGRIVDAIMHTATVKSAWCPNCRHHILAETPRESEVETDKIADAVLKVVEAPKDLPDDVQLAAIAMRSIEKATVNHFDQWARQRSPRGTPPATAVSTNWNHAGQLIREGIEEAREKKA